LYVILPDVLIDFLMLLSLIKSDSIRMAQRHPAKVDAGYGTVSNKRITPTNYLVRHFVRSRLLKRNEDGTVANIRGIIL
jgi:hypothetical protein